MNVAAEPDLAARARRAYERGRLRWALARAAAAVAVAAIALIGCPAPGAPATCAVALGVVLAACGWRGGPWGRGARLGFLVGLAPCLLPAAARAAHACCESLCLTLPTVCLSGGIVAGLLLGWLGLRVHGDRRFWLAAALAASLAGAVGCLNAGLAGLGGMALGLLAGAAAPVLAARAA
ncbi:MAG TPA: hypothetical protein VIH93_00540 [Thermoanaerobaculia bacterium]